MNLTYDTWFGRSAAPFQHHLIAIFRAIENRRYLVRSTYTGYTAVVSPLGKTIAHIPAFTEGKFTARGHAHELSKQLYELLGELPWWGLLAVVPAASCARQEQLAVKCAAGAGDQLQCQVGLYRCGTEQPLQSSVWIARPRSSLRQICAEMPEVPFRIAGAILARAIIHVLELDHDLGAGGFCPFIMGIDLGNKDVNTLGDSSQLARALHSQQRLRVKNLP